MGDLACCVRVTGTVLATGSTVGLACWVGIGGGTLKGDTLGPGVTDTVAVEM